MTWLVIGIIAWLACGFVASGFVHWSCVHEGNYEEDFPVSWQRYLAWFFVVVLSMILGPPHLFMCLRARYKWPQCELGWLAPWRTQ